MRFWLLLIGYTFLSSTSVPPVLWAQQPEPMSGTRGATDELIKSVVLATLPREYENTKHWGGTRPRWDGLHISLDGLQLKTKRRWKEVNHGTWTRYKATLVDPEHQLLIQSENLRTAANQRVAFDLIIDTKLDLVGRLSEWRQGVQLYSFGVEADATVRLAMTCEVGLKFETTNFPPDVLLSPHVTTARLELRTFNLHAISDADGPIVRKLGDGLQNVLQDEIDERRQTIVQKINRAIDKRSDKLRLSVYDLTTAGWKNAILESASNPAPDSKR